MICNASRDSNNNVEVVWEKHFEHKLIIFVLEQIYETEQNNHFFKDNYIVLI